MGEVPHLQAAVSRLKGKPFEILAVSLDDERDDLVKMIKRREIPGIQTWDAGGWDGNPVRKRYNVHDIPTWYLIDATGIIRMRDPLGEALVPAVEAMLRSGANHTPE